MDIDIIQGDVLDVLRTIPDCSVQCCVTSPPYYGLRDYGIGGQIGLEPSPDEYVAKLVMVFREVRRVLRDDGTCWLNLGDSYNGSGGEHKDGGGQNGIGVKDRGRVGIGIGQKHIDYLKPKDLIGIPWRVAFALQADGWWLRQDIIWHKPNPMPESVKDRCTKAHEYIFLLTKSARYYYDAEAVKEPTITKDNSHRNRDITKLNNTPGRTRMGGLKENNYDVRNARSVWTITTKPYRDAHFATFPPELPERCIKAGSKVGDTILDPFCGAGTTGLVAARLGRSFIGIELNPEYCEMARRRIDETQISLSLEV